MNELDKLLDESAALHRGHLCPRQVLGIRLGLYGAEMLGVDVPVAGHELLVIVETDGCFADGVSVATGCTVGHRTMRVVDYGKVAATLIDRATGEAVRLAPRRGVRGRAADYAPGEKSRWHTQLVGYQRMPADELLTCERVTLSVPLEQILSKPGCRVACDRCGEEIINEREVRRGDEVLCRACAGGGYYASRAG